MRPTRAVPEAGSEAGLGLAGVSGVLFVARVLLFVDARGPWARLRRDGEIAHHPAISPS